MRTVCPSFASSFSGALLALATLVVLSGTASAQAPGTLAAPGAYDVIASALEELPEQVRSDVTEMMSSMNMTADTTHFQRFVSREDGAVVNASMALIK